VVYFFAFLFVAVSAMLAWLAGPLLHLHGAGLFVVHFVLLILGVAAAIAVLFFQRNSKLLQTRDSNPHDTLELNTLLRNAQRHLNSSQRASTRSLASTPLLYLLGGPNSAKTTTMLRSGLDPELLAGEVYRDRTVAATSCANVWYTGENVIVEAGEAVRNSSQLWNQMLRLTRPKMYQTALGKKPPFRAAIVCTSCESFFGPDAAASLMALARKTNGMLRTLARQLGTNLPVYVVLTKLDRIPGFGEFVRHLSTEEISAPLGVSLPRHPLSGRLYAEELTISVSSSLDQLLFSLGEFRLELLAREDGRNTAAPVYEFPREMAKLRNNLVSYLVELTRPSHLNANPHLHGFYFTGVRAHISEQAVSVPAAERRQAQPDAEATGVFSLKNLAENSPRPVVAQVVTQKTAQWCFLPHLFSKVFADRKELAEGQTSKHAYILRRLFFATVSTLLLIWCIGLTLSYRNNARLEQEIQAAEAALPAGSPVEALAPASQLASLDHLRSAITELEGYEQNGAPLSFKWGLFHGDSLITPARRLYFDRFQQLLLASTQKHLVANLNALPANAPADSDYFPAYNSLRAYLITTSNPEKSTSDFLPPVLFRFWLNGRPQESALQSELAERQFAFYAEEIRHADPFHIAPSMPAVVEARLYLDSFGGFDRIYQNMIAAANQATPAVDFNRLYPGSAATVVEPHVVPGAFTRDGFTYLQKALQHPDHFLRGEDWVLGGQTAPSLQLAQLTQKLMDRYTTDFTGQWHTFLRSAVVIRYRSLQEAQQKLQSLSSPNSSLLALIFTASHHTAATSPAIAHQFQPVQALVPPDSANRFIAGSNSSYINGLISLQGAISQFNQDTTAANNPTATQPVISAAVAAHAAVGQTSQSFNIDPQGHVEQIVISLLQAPITSVEDTVRGERPQQTNLAGIGFCSSVSALTAKYPFARGAKVEATAAEITSIFKPGSGALWTFYDASLKSLIVQQGATWVAAPNGPIKPTAAFLQFFNRMATLSTQLFPAGATVPTITFNAHILRSKEIQSVTFTVDAQSLTGADVSRSFTWSAPSAQNAELIANYGSGSLPLQFSGIWALFHLADRGKLEQSGAPARLAYPLEISNTPIVIHGTPLTEQIEFSGPGASLLVPGALNGLQCITRIAH